MSRLPWQYVRQVLWVFSGLLYRIRLWEIILGLGGVLRGHAGSFKGVHGGGRGRYAPVIPNNTSSVLSSKFIYVPGTESRWGMDYIVPINSINNIWQYPCHYWLKKRYVHAIELRWFQTANNEDSNRNTITDQSPAEDLAGMPRTADRYDPAANSD